MLEYTCIKKITDEYGERCDYVLQNKYNKRSTLRYSKILIINFLENGIIAIDNIKLGENGELIRKDLVN